MENDFLKYGPIQVLTGQPFEVSDNYGTEDDSVDCEFLSWFETEEDFDLENPTCIKYDATECLGFPPATASASTSPAEPSFPPGNRDSTGTPTASPSTSPTEPTLPPGIQDSSGTLRLKSGLCMALGLAGVYFILEGEW